MSGDPRFAIPLSEHDKKRASASAMLRDITLSEWVRALIDEWPISEPLPVTPRERAVVSVRLDPKRRAKLQRLARRARVSTAKGLALMITERLGKEAPRKRRTSRTAAAKTGAGPRRARVKRR